MRLRNLTLAIASVALMAAAFALPNATASEEPPPLADHPTQPVEPVHVPPATCTVLVDSDGNEVCREVAELWECAEGLSAEARYRTTADLTYNEVIAPSPPAARDTHCRFVQFVAAYPRAPFDTDRPLSTCITEFVNGTITRGECQTDGDPLTVEPALVCPDGSAPLGISDTGIGFCRIGGADLLCDLLDPDGIRCESTADPATVEEEPAPAPVPMFTG